jgi:low affinity Fe/Cu permease
MLAKNDKHCRTLNERFHGFAQKTATAMGSAWAFLSAFLVILCWGALGPLFHFSDSWQLVINTGTTIITFLMVFLIQNTQNRDARALHLKLDELLRSGEKARNHLIELQKLSDEELDELEHEFARCRKMRTAVPEPNGAQSRAPTTSPNHN